MTPRVLCTVLLFLTLPASVSAQAGPEPFSLRAALGIALEDNPEVRRAREQIEEFRFRVRGVAADALPKVDLAGALQQARDPGLRNSQFFSRLPGGGDPFPAGALDPFFAGTYYYQLEVEQPVWQFGRVRHAREAARHELEGVRLDVRTMEQRVAGDVARAYLDLLLARERRKVLETEQRTRERQLAQVRDRLELEDATRLDLLRAQVALANLRPETLAAENAIRLATARLNETLGREPSAPMGALDALEVPETLPALPDVDRLLALAAERRPELQRFARSRQVLREAEQAIRADVLPEVTARATLGINSYQLENLGRPSFHNWAVGLNVRWALFDGRRTASTIGQYRSQRRQSEQEEQAFRAALAREIERVRGDWRQAVETLEVSALAVEQAREAQRVAEESFHWGAATFLDVLETERSLREAELARIQAYHGTLVALAEIKTLVGLRPDADDAELLREAAGAAGPGAASGQP